MPVVKDVGPYSSMWKTWWSNLQQSRRQHIGVSWPLERSSDKCDWTVLMRGGCNGFFLVVMSLSWWVAAVKSKEEKAELDDVLDDVSWVLANMISSSSGSASKRTQPYDVEDDLASPAKKAKVL